MSDAGTEREPIPPALSVEEWASWQREGISRSIGTACDAISFGLHQDPAKLIALANAALPDSDPRKITRAMVAALREQAATMLRHMPALPLSEWREGRMIERIADALASYLPPEGP